MTMLPLIAAIVVSAAAIAYVVWPLLQSGKSPIMVEDDRLTELMARKDGTLVAIKELEFDYHTGKLSDEDFERMNQRLRRQAIVYIKQIETVAPESARVDEQIEAEIAALRKTDSAAAADVRSTSADLPSETIPAVAAESVATNFCTNCGHPLQPTHKFCAKCGAPVQVNA